MSVLTVVAGLTTGFLGLSVGPEVKARADLQLLAQALERHRWLTGDYPYSEAAFWNLAGVVDAVSRQAEVGGGDSRAFVDPWGHPYVYRYRDAPSAPWRGGGFLLYSKGPDGEDTSAVLGVWDRADARNADNVYP